MGFGHREVLDRSLPPDLLHREALPYDAAFLAAKCFLAYRRAGGTKTSPLPDFYIGAHAAVAGYRLLTRDARATPLFPGAHHSDPEHPVAGLTPKGVRLPRAQTARRAPEPGSNSAVRWPSGCHDARSWCARW
ncbi:MAG TPA: type II toxin-antitoxin system VapC family toxin [Cryptosporangiaceae bacterium]|nr:type II toxin-antitoxin system VapC family toxin [Cryptosporangiaceae bacterium]